MSFPGYFEAMDYVHIDAEYPLDSIERCPPGGDGSLIRMANLYANICHVGQCDDKSECFEIVTGRSAKPLGLTDNGSEVGKSAVGVVLDRQDRESAVAKPSPAIYRFKRGRMTFEHTPARLARPA